MKERIKVIVKVIIKGITTGYVLMSFEEFYTRKLEALKVELKDIIYGAIPFITSQEYACKKCFKRLKLHADGKMSCLMCDPLPTNWSKETRACVSQIFTTTALSKHILS
jgi:hypothetical protein